MAPSGSVTTMPPTITIARVNTSWGPGPERGAEFSGIPAHQMEPQNEAFLRLFSGQTPEGEKLKPHESEIIGYDFQCSAQKSVSIMAKLAGADRLLEAHKQAVTEAYGKLES